LGSDQTSLHNPGGYYPDISFEDANEMMAENPILFKKKYRKHYAVIRPSINTQQKPISLIMEMLLLEASREELI
jgi:urocanate hydratase